MKERSFQDLINDGFITERGSSVVDYSDYGNFDGPQPNYRGGHRSRLSQDSAEEPSQGNILDDSQYFSASSFFGILSGANRKQTQSYVQIVNFDDLKSETETYLRRDSLCQYTGCTP